MKTRKAWLEFIHTLEREKSYQISGCRKIVSPVIWSHEGGIDKSIQLEDIGFTVSKMRMLEKNYYNAESIEAARKLWKTRLETGRYGSVGITGYNHFVKGNVSGASPRGSTMGPCIQAVTFTTFNGKEVFVDCFYRTTEAYKKFPADLVFLRDKILPLFTNGVVPVARMTYHFANVTIHPMYWITSAALMGDPVWELYKIKCRDMRLWTWIVKWTGRYLCPEYHNGIEKFAQAVRTGEAALQQLSGKNAAALRKYCRESWPGVKHRGKSEKDEE